MDMNEFVRCIAKLAVVLGVVLFIGAAFFAGILIFAPGVLGKAVYYAAIIGCLAVAGYMLFGLLRVFVSYIGAKRKRFVNNED